MSTPIAVGISERCSEPRGDVALTLKPVKRSRPKGHRHDLYTAKLDGPIDSDPVNRQQNLKRLLFVLSESWLPKREGIDREPRYEKQRTHEFRLNESCGKRASGRPLGEVCGTFALKHYAIALDIRCLHGAREKLLLVAVLGDPVTHRPPVVERRRSEQPQINLELRRWEIVNRIGGIAVNQTSGNVDIAHVQLGLESCSHKCQGRLH